MSLTVSQLHVTVEGVEILHGVSIDVAPGSVHVMMGPNGSGKSTFAYALSGHPRYLITSGKVNVDEVDATHLRPDERAREGLFLSFQYPVEVMGVPVRQFLRTAYEAIHEMRVDPVAFSQLVKKEMSELRFDPSFANRSVNEGFSGGEKKRLEMLQLSVLEPRYAVLDETDSGLDVDAIKLVAESVKRAKARRTGILLITHYPRILEFIVPDQVHVVIDGRIAQSGDVSLAHHIEEHGYELFRS
ncbi:MAG: Fe-S cluster assembly ATPase SufC [Patescibacteria group bacterium]|jgi:Fe-S cluster assembly ATP-binding protein